METEMTAKGGFYRASIALAFFVMVLGATPASAKNAPNFVHVKYLAAPVDIAHPRFEKLDTSRSSFVVGAWYDDESDYMIINLGSIFYHYCRMPESAWAAFRTAESFGKHYSSLIKGEFDCRQGGVPQYGSR
jgi:hypothetical protein